MEIGSFSRGDEVDGLIPARAQARRSMAGRVKKVRFRLFLGSAPFRTSLAAARAILARPYRSLAGHLGRHELSAEFWRYGPGGNDREFHVIERFVIGAACLSAILSAQAAMAMPAQSSLGGSDLKIEKAAVVTTTIVRRPARAIRRRVVRKVIVR